MKNQHGGVILLGDYLYGYSDNVGWLCAKFAQAKKCGPNAAPLGKGAVAWADGMLYCVSEDRGIVALVEATPDGWSEKGRFTLEPQSEIRSSRGKIWTHPTIANGKLFLRRSRAYLLLRHPSQVAAFGVQMAPIDRYSITEKTEIGPIR